MRRLKYDRASTPVKVTPIKPKINLTPITPSTKLVNMQTASNLLAEEKGISMAVSTIRSRCSQGKWLEGYHWRKPAKSYLIHMQAVYESIAGGKL